MRSCLIAIAATVIGPTAAQAMPLAQPIPSVSGVELAHHKPGHMGGPPWTRPGRGYVEERAYRPRAACVTRFEERYDRYRGVVVRRPVQVCRGGEGYGYGYGYR